MKGASIAALTALLVAATAAVAAASPPANPSKVSQERISSTEVLLSWQDNSNNETGFEIFRKEEFHANFQSRGTVGPNTGEFGDDVEPGVVYSYKVVAFNADGDSDDSNICFVGRTPPGVPVAVKARLIALTVVRVSWADVSSFESGFIVQRHQEGEPFQTIAVLPPNTEEFEDHHLSAANTYTYRVRALGRAARCIDNSKFSVEKTITTKGGVKVLTVVVSGVGKGTVTSVPDGIHCGPNHASCTAEFPIGIEVELKADPTSSSRFREWREVKACEDIKGKCTFNMGKDRTVEAVFQHKK